MRGTKTQFSERTNVFYVDYGFTCKAKCTDVPVVNNALG